MGKNKAGAEDCWAEDCLPRKLPAQKIAGAEDCLPRRLPAPPLIIIDCAFQVSYN